MDGWMGWFIDGGALQMERRGRARRKRGNGSIVHVGKEGLLEMMNVRVCGLVKCKCYGKVRPHVNSVLVRHGGLREVGR